MSETPDFGRIAKALALKHDAHLNQGGAFDSNMLEAEIAELLTLAWNARGEADVVAIRARMSTLVGWEASEPYLQHVAEAVAAIDR